MEDLENRVSGLERLVADLRRKQVANEDIDRALLARIDSLIDDLKRIERDQMRSFSVVMQGQREQGAMLQTQNRAIDALVAGQEQILGLLMGRSDSPKTHD